MAVQAQLPDGRVLEFPDGTDPAVVQRTVKRVLGVAEPTSVPAAPAEPVPMGNISDEMVAALQGVTEPQAEPPPTGGSIFERGVKMEPPTVDARANLEAMLRSRSPESVMFTPGRGLQRAEQIIQRGEQRRQQIEAAAARVKEAEQQKLQRRAEEEDYSLLTDLPRDIGLVAAKGVVGLGESAMGLAQILTGWYPENDLYIGQWGTMLKRLGYNPQQTKNFLTGLQTPLAQTQQEQVEAARGFLNTIKTLGVNPLALTTSVVESLPGTVMSGAAGGALVKRLMVSATQEAAERGLVGAAASRFISNKVKEQIPKIATAASAVEGAQAAGTIAEQARSAGRDWGQYVAPALAAGLGTAAIGMVSGKVGAKLGIGDIETEIAARTAGVKGVGISRDPFAKALFKEMTKEGLLEELPQSAQEQIFTNLALGKPWDEGVEEAAAKGLVLGGVMGGGHAALAKALKRTNEIIDTKLAEYQQDAARRKVSEDAAEMIRARGFYGAAIKPKTIDQLIADLDALVQQEAQQEEGAPSATEPIGEPSRAGVGVVGEPGAGAPAPGVEGAERLGVVPVGPDVEGLAAREGREPAAVEPTLEGELPTIPEGRVEPRLEAAEPQTLADYLEGLPNSKYYADLTSRDPSKIENDDVKAAYWALDTAAGIIRTLKERLPNLDHPAVTGKTPAERAAARANAPADLRDFLTLPSAIAGTASRIVNQAQALEKGYKGAKAGSRKKIDAAAKEIERDVATAIEKLLKYNLLAEDERADAERLIEERQERRAIQEETVPVAEPVSDEDIPFEPVKAAPAPQPLTVTTQARTKDEFGNAATEVTLSNGNTYTLQRLNAAESMGLPGWHYSDATVSDILGGSFLGNTKDEAIKELLRRESEKRPAAEEAAGLPQKAPETKPTPVETTEPTEAGESTSPMPSEPTSYFGSEEIDALGKKIMDTIASITSDFMVGDMVRYGNINGTVVGVDGDYVRVHPDGAKNPKAYYRVPKTSVEMVARPDTVSKTAAMAAPDEDKKFGTEQGKLNADMGGLIQLLGANMYAGSVAEVAVKELLQNAFDAVKGAVSDKKAPSLYKYGEITITFDDENRSITVTDNARGMTPEIVRNAFFTVAGSDKSDLEPDERSGGLGLAKMGFMLGSERLILDTVRDGVRVRVDTSAKDIANSNFQLVKSPAPKKEHGTSVTVKIPEFYVDPKTGDKKAIYFSEFPSGYDALDRPLIGPVVVKAGTKGSFFKDGLKTLPIGQNFPVDKYVKLKASFAWGSADIYFAKERNQGNYSWDIKHRVLSSGVFQFDTEFKANDEKIPYDIIVNVKSNVEAKHPDYPFENSRERFKARIKEDVAALNAYLAKISMGNEAQNLQDNFKNIVSMPRTEAGQDIAEASQKLKKAFGDRGAVERRELPPMPTEVRIEGTRVVSVDTGKVLTDIAKKKEKQLEGTFKAEKEAPAMEDFLLKMEQNPKLPIFHNNTNVDLLEVGRKYGDPERFFAELGTLMVEMKEALANSDLYKYDVLKPENLFFGGVSVDKAYGGVHIKVPYKAVLVNPFYDFGAKTLFGVREYLWETMTHEIAHTGDMGHGVGHNAQMLKVRQYLADQGLADYFRDALMDVLTRHESTFTAMREAYGRSTTKNLAKSLKDYESGAASASDGSAASSGEDTIRPVPAGERSGGYGDLRPSGPINRTSGIPRAAGSTAPASVKGLHPDVVDAINRNDLTGALRAIARNTSGLYSELARRLAELNLPTSIIFNNERDLVHQAINDRSAQQQIRLFAYLSRIAPDFYDKYFKDYDKTENLERVAEGLSKIDSSGIDVRPVAAELADVQRAFTKSLPGLTAPGFFVPSVDTINIRPDADFGSAYRVVLHEAVHAATEYMLYGKMPLSEAQTDAVANIYTMYAEAQKVLPPEEYGFTNISEFVAEAMTNPKFQAKLKSIPYKPQKTSFFNSLLRFVARMFGMDTMAGAAMTAINEILSAQRPVGAIKPAPLRFAPPRKRVRGPISKPDSWRTAESVQTSMMETAADAARGRIPLDTALKDLAGVMWDASGTYVRKVILPVLQLRQLKDLTRTKFPQITGAVDIIEKMVAYRGQKIKVAEDIVQKWTRLQSDEPKMSSLMGRIMIEATIRGRDPDLGVAPGAAPDALDNAWNALPSEFKSVYRSVRDFYAASVTEMVRTMKVRALGLPKAERQAMIRKIDAQFGPDKLVTPYFPLRRFGDYWFQVGKGNFKEFYMFEDPINRSLAFKRRQRQLQSGNTQQQLAAETMRMGNGVSELYSQNVATTQVLRDLEDTIDSLTATDVAGVKAELKDSLNQLVYLLLPQQSMRKMFINRKATQGASSDMLRVFAHSAVHSAYQQSRFRFAEPFVNNIQNARSYIDDMEAAKAVTPEQAAVYRDFVLELENRTKNILGIEDRSAVARIAGAVTGTTFFFMLSAPASMLLNIIGMTTMTMPRIGARYGYAKTNALMLKNLGRYAGSIPNRTLAPMAQGNFMQVSFPSIVEGWGELDPILKRAAERFVDDGDINISMTNDIFDMGEQPSALYTGKVNTVKKVMGGLFHQGERLNREVALLTAFELAYERFLNAPRRDIRGVVERDPTTRRPGRYTPDEAFDLAIQEARDIAGLTLGDYTRQMKGRIFTVPTVNLITQFKQYAITATYNVFRDLYLSVGAPFRKGEIEQFRKQMVADGLPQSVIDQRLDEAEQYRREVYREAQKRMAGVLGMTFLFGGISSLPFFSVSPFFSIGLGTLIKMFANDDDDEYFDWENWFYNYMENEVGGAAAAIFTKMGMDAKKSEKAGIALGEALARGPVATVTGTSLADRVSLDLKNLWWRDGRYSPDARESIQGDVIANLGPSIGLALNWADAWQLAGEGQWLRAYEKAAPALFAKPATAFRIGTEGATTRAGAVVGGLYEFTTWELAMQAIGLQPERLAQAQKAAIQAKTYQQKVMDQRQALLNRLWMERGTPAQFDVNRKINEFNLKYPQVAIDQDTIDKSFEARAEGKANAEAMGTKLDERLLGRTAPMMRYGME